MAAAWNILFSIVDVQTCVIVVVVLFLTYYLFISSSHELPPGPRGLPILGNLLDMRKYGPTKGHMYFRDMQQKYGDVFMIYYGKYPMVVVNGYSAVHEVLVEQGSFLGQRPVWLYGPSLTNKNGRGIIWNDGKEWSELRRMTLKALHDLGVGKSTLEERIETESNHLTEALYLKEGKLNQVRSDISRAVANVIYSVAFGNRFEYDDPVFEKLIHATDSLCASQGISSAVNAIPTLRYLPTFKRQISSFFDGANTIREYVEQQIQNHRDTYEEGVERDYIDIFISKDREFPGSTVFTVGNMTKCVVDLLLAGVETTASTLDFALLYMIKYPDVQHKCQKEIHRVVGGRRVQLSDRASLVYTQATILEVQRMAAVAAFAVPRTNCRDTWIGGYRVPRGCLISTNIYSVLHDVELWGDPHIFKPERFISPHRELIQPDSWIPFGGGPRTCVGEALVSMELFIFFTTLLQTFHFSREEGDEPDIEPLFGLTMKPKPYRLVLHAMC